MKILNGADLAEFIKSRQLHQSRSLKQAHGRQPRLAIVHTSDDPTILKYIELKQQYGQDIEVPVDIHEVSQADVEQKIKELNEDEATFGVIVQLPLSDTSQTDIVLNAIAPDKDVDGLGEKALFDPATPTAINWLLSGYNVELKQKKIVIIGAGRLVGAPLAFIWQQSGYDVVTLTEGDNLALGLKHADIIVSATGHAGLITSELLPVGCVAVDAGVADVDGQKQGDFSPEVYEREDIVRTPKYGGVGPLTVAALFDNVLKATERAGK